MNRHRLNPRPSGRGARENNVLPPGGSATFGFVANETSSPVIPATISCQSPKGQLRSPAAPRS